MVPRDCESSHHSSHEIRVIKNRFTSRIDNGKTRQHAEDAWLLVKSPVLSARRG